MRKQVTGFTLVELMIAMTLGLVVAGGIIAVFVQNQRSFRIDEQVARMQDEARFAVTELSRDLQMASFVGETLAPDAVGLDVTLNMGIDCGPAAQADWMYRFTDAVTNEINTLTSVDNATGATAVASYSCINGGEIRPNTDVVAIKRVAGATASATNPLVVGNSYTRSNGANTTLYTHPIAGVVAPPFNDRAYRPHIYYIRNFSDTPGDGLPALCRKVLLPGSPSNMGTECIARGIDDFQIEFGIDTDGDGTPNEFLTDPTLTEIQQVVSARFYVLARTEAIDTKHVDDRVYRVSNAPDYTPADQFHRRLYSATVNIINRRNAQRLRL